MKRIVAVMVVMVVGLMLSGCPVKYSDSTRKIVVYDGQTLQKALDGKVPDVPENARGLSQDFIGANPHANFRINGGNVEYQGTPAKPGDGLQYGLLVSHEKVQLWVVIVTSAGQEKTTFSLNPQEKKQLSLMPDNYTVKISKGSGCEAKTFSFNVDSISADSEYEGKKYDFVREIPAGTV